MTRTPVPEKSTVLLSGAHRVIRVLDPSEGPFAGALVTDGDGVAVCRDAEGLSGWEGWRFAGSEHVAGPTDLVRRADGHDALLPWCTERVAAYLARREVAGERLSAGECGTLLVSLLRALSELGSAAHDDELRGTWWITDDGKPVFVIGEGDRGREGVTRLVAQLAASNADRTLGRLFAAVHAGVEKSIEQQPRVPQLLLEKWEGELLEIAAPRALRRHISGTEQGPGTVRVSGMPGRSTLPARRTARGETGVSRAMGVSVRVSRWFAARWGPAVSAFGRAGTRFGRQRRVRPEGVRPATLRSEGSTSGPRASRKRTVLVATAAAAVVLLVGVLWPSGDDSGAEGSDTRSQSEGGEADVEDRTSGTPAQRSGSASSTPENGGAEGAPGDPVEGAESIESADPSDDTDPMDAAPILWGRIADCRDDDDAECPAAVAPGSAAVLQMLPTNSGATPQFTLLDQYGDIAVIRLDIDSAADAEGGEAATATGKVVVLARLNEKWLVRDVYDVADQPE